MLKRLGTSTGAAKIGCIALAITVVACGSAVFTIEDAVSIGFEKGEQQFFTMIGAIDGYAGTLSGDTIEIYEYESASDIPSDLFDNFVAPGHPSGWLEYCTVGNLAMVSKGPDACPTLRGLAG